MDFSQLRGLLKKRGQDELGKWLKNAVAFCVSFEVTLGSYVLRYKIVLAVSLGLTSQRLLSCVNRTSAADSNKRNKLA